MTFLRCRCEISDQLLSNFVYKYSLQSIVSWGVDVLQAQTALTSKGWSLKASYWTECGWYVVLQFCGHLSFSRSRQTFWVYLLTGRDIEEHSFDSCLDFCLAHARGDFTPHECQSASQKSSPDRNSIRAATCPGTKSCPWSGAGARFVCPSTFAGHFSA